MSYIKSCIIILSLFTSVLTFGQDTISIYFNFGESKIPNRELKKLTDIPSNYDLSELDSINFIGMADSIGDFKQNLKLSEKRVLNTYRKCKNILPKNIAIRKIAIGEKTNKKKEKNRRVDIILYFQPFQNNEIDDNNDINKLKKICYNIDYELLHRCHLRVIKKRKKKFTIIETSVPYLNRKKEHYYGFISKNGEFKAKKIRWSSRRTGNFWWAETRYVAKIPKESFDKYKIFKIEKPPCKTCSENFKKTSKILNKDTCIQVDRFLMKNIQLKRQIFTINSIKVRAPKEYVNINDKYFIGCNFENELKWKTKNWRKRKNYFYTKIPRYPDRVANITRIMDCCKSNPEPSECNASLIKCDSRLLTAPDRSFILNAKFGNHYLKSKHYPYMAIGISKEGLKGRLGVFLGTDIELSFYSSFKYQYHFLSFPFSSINPFPKWHSPTNYPLISRYARLYFGSELNIKTNKIAQATQGQNFHLGISFVNLKDQAIINRIFFQYGYELDYSGNRESFGYPIIHLGFNIKIYKFNNVQLF